MGSYNKSRKPNGNGTVYFSEKENRWRAEIHWTDKNGKQCYKKFSGKKQIAVKNKLEAFKRQLIITSDNVSDSDVTFKEYADNWLHTILKNKLKPTSYTRKEISLTKQVYPYIGDIPMKDVTRNDVQDMVNSLVGEGLSYSTIKKAYEAVSGCFREYRIKTNSTLNPCEGITLPDNSRKEVSNILFFDKEQRSLIISEATRKYSTGKPVYRLGYSIIALMHTGLRISELLALTWDDIDFEAKTLTVNKNAVVVKVSDNEDSQYKLINQDSSKTRSGSRIVPLNRFALQAFQEIQKINGDKKYVMSSKNNQQITPRNINRMFHSILTQTGIADKLGELCGVHTLRHTFASMLFQKGCTVKVVSEILGHSDTKITENIYIHVIQQQKIQAVQNIDDFSE